MPRLLFEKTGNAVWMSHLDLMRLFQRAFRRAELPLTHTHGFNPRPSVSIALPLSVGVESQCELLDFDLEEVTCSCQEITRRLNAALVPGIRVLETYENGRKIRDIAYLACRLELVYDRPVTEADRLAIEGVFAAEQIIVEKKGKNGPADVNIKPMIRELALTSADDRSVTLCATVCCQNPSLNPMLLISAISKYAPGQTPDHTLCRRLEIYDTNAKPFR